MEICFNIKVVLWNVISRNIRNANTFMSFKMNFKKDGCLAQRLTQANEIISNLQVENDRLKMELAEQHELNNVNTDGKTYNANTHETVFFFLRNKGVSCKTVISPVIDLVVTKLANKTSLGSYRRLQQ